MSNYWDTLIAEAGKKSISEFSESASSLTKLTKEEIVDLIPAGVDHAKFAELMSIVKDSTKSNIEKAAQIRKVTGFAEIATNLLIKLV
jgi:hypothetical protein